MGPQILNLRIFWSYVPKPKFKLFYKIFTGSQDARFIGTVVGIAYKKCLRTPWLNPTEKGNFYRIKSAGL